MTRGGAVSNTTAPRSRTRGRVDVREWAGGIRFSAFTGIMLGLVVLAVFVLVPTVGTYLSQRQEIAALTASVQLTADEVADLQLQKDRWSDPAYVTSQARARLYYVRPGEVVYLVDDDLPPASIPLDQQPVSDEVEQTRSDWMAQLVRSVAAAGLAETATGPTDATDPATPTP
ncbi:MAG: septum formation initiator [Microbacterium sp. SCN 70-200]|nr:MAG: septum formation initiator [Microbacterium sp. SCN 70-200]OJV84992.1 MAG: septum formation initiator [Microbacterium sp. 70-16]